MVTLGKGFTMKNTQHVRLQSIAGKTRCGLDANTVNTFGAYYPDAEPIFGKFCSACVAGLAPESYFDPKPYVHTGFEVGAL